MDDYTPILSPEERAERRKKRAAARRKKQQARRRRILLQVMPASILGLVLIAAVTVRSHGQTEEPVNDMPAMAAAVSDPVEPEIPAVYTASPTASTVQLGDEISSSYAILIDLQNDTILAEKAADTVINPASMTKVLTLLVAAENLKSLDDTFTMTLEVSDYCYVNGCSVVGLMPDETVTIRDLLYGTILPSGADAAMGLAISVAGSHEAFVDLMNEKLEELGLSDTAHFTNCVGLYDEDHSCTIYDMAMILKAAMDNELCREVLSAHTYEIPPTEQHPEGQTLSNWFLRRIEDHDQGQAVRAVGAKTGYVVQSGSCAVSWGEDADGNRYICATGDAGSSWQAIYDHAALYKLCSGDQISVSDSGGTEASQQPPTD